ncbi:MAG: TlpA disulfide reductase family protein [Pseudomonadota bacterium]
MKTKDIAIGAVAALFISALAYVWLAPAGFGSAPSVTFKTLTGEQIQLDDLRGKPVLVTFWATSCVGCMREMPHLIEMHHDLHAQGLEIIGVAMDYDPPNHVVETVESRQVPYTISLDIDGAIAAAFDQVRLTPTNYLINPDGRVVFKKIGEMDIAKLRDDIIQMLQKGSA